MAPQTRSAAPISNKENFSEHLQGLSLLSAVAVQRPKLVVPAAPPARPSPPVPQHPFLQPERIVKRSEAAPRRPWIQAEISLSHISYANNRKLAGLFRAHHNATAVKVLNVDGRSRGTLQSLLRFLLMGNCETLPCPHLREITLQFSSKSRSKLTYDIGFLGVLKKVAALDAFQSLHLDLPRGRCAQLLGKKSWARDLEKARSGGVGVVVRSSSV
ncbi:hypothetical protein K474DRAFT_1675215 [Panus rudis PR-1116 ss-1]|nr:hypothetical protein K474DRAFT_1675215 [Panus rudis PR-1116 ss-1]